MNMWSPMKSSWRYLNVCQEGAILKKIKYTTCLTFYYTKPVVYTCIWVVPTALDFNRKVINDEKRICDTNYNCILVVRVLTSKIFTRVNFTCC